MAKEKSEFVKGVMSHMKRGATGPAIQSPASSKASVVKTLKPLTTPQPNTEEGQMPSYKKGGIVKKTGPALLHKGELVVPKHRMTSDGFMRNSKKK